MDVLPLDKDTFLPDGLVEGFTSKIWTERYGPAGDFQFKTPLINETREKLPEDTLITLRDSDTVMVVENHEIGVDEDGIEELTITGRTFETFLEKRYIVGDYGVPWALQLNYTVQDALMLYIWNSVVNPHLYDVTRPGDVPHIAQDNIPNVLVSDSVVPTSGPITYPGADEGEFDPSDLVSTQEWWIGSGQIYKQVVDFLNVGKLGIRIIRPVSVFQMIADINAGGAITKIPSSGSSGGTDPIFWDYGGDHLRFDIYNGRNRTVNPSEVDYQTPVVFRYDAGHLESPKYLFSSKDYMNAAYVASSQGDMFVWDPSAGDYSGPGDTVRLPSGLEYRSMYVDYGTVDDSVTDLNEALRQRGLAELKLHNRQKILDGAVSPNSKNKYNVDYFLGDYVTFMGKYGVVEDMQVAEYIRTEDAAGERGYPTLVHKE